MQTRRAVIFVIAAALAALAGCSGGGGTVPFADCGNGRLDAGEQCDDGNTDDNDDCLSTCVLARCGDTFIDSQGTNHEECDGTNFGGLFCSDLGFGSGNLRCNPNCTIDTSACPPPPLTPTPTSTPLPTSTPPPVCQSLTVTVSLAYKTTDVPNLGGLVVDLNYLPEAVSIPGSGSDDSVVGRLTDLSGAQGLFTSILDQNTNSDSSDDRLHSAYSAGNNIAAGPFEQVLFDCVAGAGTPPVSAFSCAVSDTVDLSEQSVTGVSCAVAITQVIAPWPTTVASVTPTATPTPTTQLLPTATATSTGSICGDGVIEAGETCDDGNTVTNPPADTCPADCTIITCTPSGVTQAVSVSFTPPAGKNVATITVLLEYPDGTVQIPGAADAESVTMAVTNTPSGFLASSFDYDYALKVGIVGNRALTPGQLFRVTFDSCQGAAPPTAEQLNCRVLDASDTHFNPVNGVTCSAAPL